MRSEYRHGTFLWLSILVALITFVVYIPALQNGFVNWDDDVLVYKNQHIRFINQHFLGWSITDISTGLWHPFVWFSLTFDYAIWGLNPLGYHLSNIFFHVANTLLVFILAILILRYNKPKRSRSVLIGGFIASLLFGIHPLHVESVAWVSERKDVLCGLFFLLSLLFYLKYVSCKTLKRFIYYGASLCLFALSLMSKPMAVTLPAIFFLIDFYPLKRFGQKVLLRVFLEKIPFLISSILASVITIRVQDLARSFETVPLMERVFIAMHNYILYLLKMAFPFNLAPFYPYLEKAGIFTYEYIGSLILFLLVTFVSYRSLKREKAFFTAWFYYVITLIPVAGIIKVGEFVTADRYAYLPSISIFLLVGLSTAVSFEKRYRYITIAFLIILSGILADKTVRQIAVWHDSLTLWSYEIKLFPNAFIAYNNRGNAYSNMGNLQEAIKDYYKAIELNPDAAEVYFNLGIVYTKLGQIKTARIYYNKAAALGLKRAEDLLSIQKGL